MRIFGIDPGTHRVGWGLISNTGSRNEYLASGIIEIPPHTDEPTYLTTLYHDLTKLLIEHHPDRVAIEKLFFQTNVKTAITVAEGRGVILLAVAQANLPYVEFSPNTIKAAVAGNGSAGKTEVTRMVSLLLNCDTQAMLDDTCDALAIALTGSTYHGV